MYPRCPSRTKATERKEGELEAEEGELDSKFETAQGKEKTFYMKQLSSDRGAAAWVVLVGVPGIGKTRSLAAAVPAPAAAGPNGAEWGQVSPTRAYLVSEGLNERVEHYVRRIPPLSVAAAPL